MHVLSSHVALRSFHRCRSPRGSGYNNISLDAIIITTPLVFLGDPVLLSIEIARYVYDFKRITLQANIAAGRVSFRNAPIDTAMVYIVWLHYALRILLIIFDRLKSLGLVRVGPAIVRCHVFLIRVILTRPQQPPHHRLRAIVICVRTLSRLIAIMKPSTVACCAIANEYLRRIKQPSCDAANRTRPEHQVELFSTAIEQTSDNQTTEAQAQPALNHVQSLVTSTANERCDTVAVSLRTIALDKISAAPSKSRSDAK